MFYIPIHKVLNKRWRHFTSLKLCKCSSINSQQNKNKPPLAQSSTDTPHALNYATSLAVGLRGCFQIPGITKENFGVPY